MLKLITPGNITPGVFDIMATKKDEQSDIRTETHEYTTGVKDPRGKPYKYTQKEQAFVRHYLDDAKFNASEAAMLAGFGTSGRKDGYTRKIACNLMKKPAIVAAINQAFEALAMPKYETIYRLSKIAAGSVADLLDENDQPDLDRARDTGAIDIIKKIKIRRVSKLREVVSEEFYSDNDLRTLADKGDGETETRERIEVNILTEEIEIEIHDPIRAHELLGKYGKLFTDKIEHLGKDGEKLPESAKVVIMLPDNGRGDASPALIAKPNKRTATRTGQSEADGSKDA